MRAMNVLDFLEKLKKLSGASVFRLRVSDVYLFSKNVAKPVSVYFSCCFNFLNLLFVNTSQINNSIYSKSAAPLLAAKSIKLFHSQAEQLILILDLLVIID